MATVEVRVMFDSVGSLVMAVAAVWLAIGVMLSMVMGRRGHDRFGWLVPGALCGPLGVILAVDARRHDEVLAPAAVNRAAASSAGGGPVDVLVGFDGSPESAAVLGAVRALFGDRLGRLTVAAVVPFGEITEQERAAREGLARLALMPGPAPQLEILHGRPATALRTYAAEGGYELIAVGTRGAGATKGLLGRAANELAHAGGKVPVLLVGAH
jgi:nucleotide-binding universal stress UspA family protein